MFCGKKCIYSVEVVKLEAVKGNSQLVKCAPWCYDAEDTGRMSAGSHSFFYFLKFWTI